MRTGLQQLLVAVLASAAATGCATAAHRPTAFPGAPAADRDLRITRPATLSGDAVVASALSLLGVPYRLGGETPDRGLDCSGLVAYVFGAQGVDLPRTVAEQYAVGRRIRTSDVQPGDLLFFSTTGPGATHVGIATGSPGEFVHAPGTGSVVRVDRIDASYWRARLIGARRIID
jgi:cell wall-associated NlpC family hydrolase